MKIGIIGTRGIPNNYGGFEQFAELLSISLVKKNHSVTVYNTEDHPFKENNYKGVNIIHCYNPEGKIGTVAQFIYDFKCIIDSRKRNFDIILQLGYTSSSIWYFLLPKKSLIITNMDGLEWKRTKYTGIVKSYLKFAEKLAVKKSDYLISDSIGIQEYLKKKFKVNSKYIAYGSSLFKDSNVNLLDEYQIKPYEYNLLIARIEPENSIDIIIKGVNESKSSIPLLVIGNYDRNNYGRELYEKYKKSKKILFLGAIYNSEKIDNLRYFSQLYFHGHTVGGTNPSLLEAMGCKCLIIAHKNKFNSSVLQEDAFYFKDYKDVSNYSDTIKREDEKNKISNNLDKITKYYNSENINNIYETFFYECLQKKG